MGGASSQSKSGKAAAAGSASAKKGKQTENNKNASCAKQGAPAPSQENSSWAAKNLVLPKGLEVAIEEFREILMRRDSLEVEKSREEDQDVIALYESVFLRWLENQMEGW